MGEIDSGLFEVLQQEKRFFTAQGELLPDTVWSAAMQMDVGLLHLLLRDPRTRKHFFTEVDGIPVFDKVQFGWAVRGEAFQPDVRCRSRIGLIDEQGRYLTSCGDVVLTFPYKDCVLEGGQTKEDQHRKERFYHVGLESDEVKHLLSPKALMEAVRYTPQGEEPAVCYGDRENLLIKGNNLLVLSSLCCRYEGTVKLAYADIPYNTGSDSFGYNDRFSRSTWLTFIKNRVEILRELLAPDGVLLIQCSFHQYAYLKVLLDEIMGEDCHKVTLNLLVRHPQRILTGDKEFNDVMEYLLVYSRCPDYKMPRLAEPKEVDNYVYQVIPMAEGTPCSFGEKQAVRFLPGEYRIEKGKPDGGKCKPISVRGSIKEKNSSGRFYVKYLQSLVGQFPPETLFQVEGIGDDRYPHRWFQLPKAGNKNGVYYQGMPTSSNVTLRPYPNFFDFMDAYNTVNGEGAVEFRNGKKPEKLLRQLLTMFTQPGDLVLDPFAGSGTTCAVAHKMGRHYIGIEQMDFIREITRERLQRVIAGEQGGISQMEHWQGGGSFIYAELAERNSALQDQTHLYVDLADLENAESAISEQDRAFTKWFYSC